MPTSYSHQKGDVAEIKVAAKLRELGHTILFPFDDGIKYDLVVDTGDDLLKVQVKSSNRDGESIVFSCYNTKGSEYDSKTFYGPDDIDGIAVYDSTDESFYWVPVEDINRYSMRLRHDPDAKNSASEYPISGIS